MIITSCNKQDSWLDVKRNRSDLVPQTIQDYQSLLDNDRIMNANYPSLGLIGSDNYYVTSADWQSLGVLERNAYIWADEVYQNSNADWTCAYQIIAYANAVLDGLKKIKPDQNSVASFNRTKGSALFFRSNCFFNIAQIFAKPYHAATASDDLGIVLKLTADVNEPIVRHSIKETYDRIISDLIEAQQLLQEFPTFQTQPSKLSAEALLARVYLTMGDYDKARDFSNLALSRYSQLIDFNTLNESASFPFGTFGKNLEVIFYATPVPYNINYANYLNIVDSSLYALYDDDDLRKTIFYIDNGNGIVRFKGTYTGGYDQFAGIATNELLLIRSECYARLNETNKALEDLNALLSNRFKPGAFVPVNAASAEDALKIIIQERRKEMPFNADIRWLDLRRLNKESKFAVTQKRIINGTTYTLNPNDNKYTYPIPPDEISVSNIPQNPR